MVFFRENAGRTLGDLKLEYQTRFPKFTSEMKINKGGVGQFIEKLIGLKNTNALTDFADGELKTNKADKDGAPLETMFISQISSNFDQLISDQISFEDSWIYQKIKSTTILTNGTYSQPIMCKEMKGVNFSDS